MKKYILPLIMLVVILTSCSTPQHGYNYKKHSNTQKKIFLVGEENCCIFVEQ